MSFLLRPAATRIAPSYRLIQLPLRTTASRMMKTALIQSAQAIWLREIALWMEELSMISRLVHHLGYLQAAIPVAAVAVVRTLNNKHRMLKQSSKLLVSTCFC